MLEFKINKVTNIAPKSGRMLIAEPFMRDPEFSRSVIYICNHDADGTLGLSLNRTIEENLRDLVPSFNLDWPVYFGGPLESNTLFVLHTLPNIIGGESVGNGIYMGAEISLLKNAMQLDIITQSQIKFFLGYSGWSGGQLDNELKEESWLVAHANVSVVFNHNNQKEIYKKSLETLGKQFSSIALLPTSPSLN